MVLALIFGEESLLTNYWYFELVAALILIVSTLLAVLLIRLAVRSAVRLSKSCKPAAEAVIYYSSDCECFEAAMTGLMKSSAARAFDLRIRVVDTEKTDQSRRYLAALRNKLKTEFEIE